MNEEKAIDQIWRDQSYIIRAFLDLRPKYKKLGEEIAYILNQNVRLARIEYASITCRAKTLDSFCEKAIRKKYRKPLDEMSDMAGVRIVYLYLHPGHDFFTAQCNGSGIAYGAPGIF